MEKQIYILNDNSGSSGVVKVIKNYNKSVLSVYLEQNIPGRKTCRIICEKESLDIGSFYKKRANFEINSNIKIKEINIIDESGAVVARTEKSPESENDIEKNSTTSELTFENFFGGGFEWHRIRGNFIMFDYSIIHHILSMKEVYPAINRAGYYCAGIRKDGELTLIAVAIPTIKGTTNPFSGISADTYRIKSGKTEFESLCVGIDKTGEFFISK